MIVIDSNVLAKLFSQESDSATALAALSHFAETETPVIVPTLFPYELAQIARYHGFPVPDALALLEAQLSHNWQLVAPQGRHWQKAEAISHYGHEKSGYPALYDAIYHALAILSESVFLTADQKYYRKARQFGHILLLADWQQLEAR